MKELTFAVTSFVAAIPPIRRNAGLRRVMGLLRDWRECAHSGRRLYELNDHLLRDIGLTRDALLREAPRPF
jgi:uncharacterized protein YjiS (DUF1127 family)